MRKKKDLCVCGERKGACMRGEGKQHKDACGIKFKINFCNTHAHIFSILIFDLLKQLT